MPPKMSMSQFVEPVSSKDFTGVIKLRILRWEDILGYPGGPNLVVMVLIREKQEGQSQRRRQDDGSRG